MNIAVMKQALEVLEQINKLSIGENAISLPGEIDAAMDNLRAAIEQAGEPYIAVNNDRITIDPVTGNVSIGIPAAPRQEQYDQTALELCEECGWKAIIPSDGCLVCARQKAKPVAYMYDFMSDNEVIRDWVTQSYDDIKRENGFNVRPLYTTPPAATQKPIAYADSRVHGWPDCFVMEPDPPHTVPLYAAPREWVGLTEIEICDIEVDELPSASSETFSFARAIEAKLREKNHAG